MSFKHQLGLEAKDKISGFVGIITARVDYLTGCNRYCLNPREIREGKIVDSQYFDEDQIEITGQGLCPDEVQGEKKGACAPSPAFK